MSEFEGRVALVTGAGSGIGAAIARDLAAHGATVVVSDIDPEAADAVASEITQRGGRAEGFTQDTSKAEDSLRAVNFAIERFGGLHLAVNNAGIAGPHNRVGELDVADWDKVIDVDLNGVLYGMRYEIEQFLKEDPAKTAIVNMASIHGAVAAPGNAAYTAAKHAVVGMTRNAAVEYAADGIRINAVGPAYIDTPLLKNLSPEQREALVGKHPMGRLGRAEEVAAVVRFLLSDEASFVTGAYWLIDGGYTAV